MGERDMQSDDAGTGESPDAQRLRAEVDALLLDPRGRFRPRPLMLSDAAGDGTERLVMQVGVGGDGRIRVVTGDPLDDAGVWRVTGLDGEGGARDGLYRLDDARPGWRPEDADGPPCWINTLAPVDAPDGKVRG